MNNAGRLAATIVVVGLIGCTTTPQFQTGPDAEVTYDGLTKLDKTILDVVWGKTDIDLAGYDKIMLERVGVSFRPSTGPYSGRAGSGTRTTSTRSRDGYQLDEETKAIVIEELDQAFTEELSSSDAYEIVEEPGPDVLTLRVGLIDVVSQVPPEPIGRSQIYLSSVGEATLVMELRDSMSNAILLRAVDRRAAEPATAVVPPPSNVVSNRFEVRRLGRRWASILKNALEKSMNEDWTP